GRATIDQNDERLVLSKITWPRVEALRFFGVPTAGRYNLALLQERIGNRDCLIEQTAGIVAQVENITLELVVGDLRADVGDGLLQPLGCLLIELSQPDITDVIAFGLRAYRAHTNDVARNRYLNWFILTFARDRQLDLGIHRPAHFFDGLIQGQPLNLLVVELGDDVVGHDASLGGRRFVDWRHHLDQPVFHGDLDAEPAELTSGL